MAGSRFGRLPESTARGGLMHINQETEIMITVSVNGESRTLPENTTLAALLRDLEINNRYCAVEQNRSLVPREDHDERVLADADSIEIVTLVGGG